MRLGNPDHVCELQPIDFAAVARGFGVADWSVDDPAECGEALARSMPARRKIALTVASDTARELV